MRCPWCSSLDDKVIDSRAADDGVAIRRRRECLVCSRRFTTYERIDDLALTVVKRSGERMPFERAKVLAGLRAATKNLPLSTDQLDSIAMEVEEELRLEGPEITSEKIGVAVLNRAPFEFDAHAPSARAAGVSDEQLAALRAGEPGALFNSVERAVLALTDTMTRDVQVPDALFEPLREHFDDRVLVELVATIAAYNMVSRFLEALRIGH